MTFVLENISHDHAFNELRVEYEIHSHKFDDLFFGWIFKGDIPSHYFLKNHHLVFDIIFGMLYLLTPVILALFFLYVRIRMTEYFEGISLAALLTAGITFFIFLIFPTPPPWFTYYYGSSAFQDITIDKRYAAGGLWNIEKEFEFIPITDILSEFAIFKFGSFPSIHIIIGCQIFLFLRKMNSKYRHPALILVILNSVGIVYLGHHYVADVIGGILLSLIIVKLSLIKS
jgi:membrane-associated phospholipid phosphatase